MNKKKKDRKLPKSSNQLVVVCQGKHFPLCEWEGLSRCGPACAPACAMPTVSGFMSPVFLPESTVGCRNEAICSEIGPPMKARMEESSWQQSKTQWEEQGNEPRMTTPLPLSLLPELQWGPWHVCDYPLRAWNLHLWAPPVFDWPTHQDGLWGFSWPLCQSVLEGQWETQAWLQGCRESRWETLTRHPPSPRTACLK